MRYLLFALFILFIHVETIAQCREGRREYENRGDQPKKCVCPDSETRGGLCEHDLRSDDRPYGGEYRGRGRGHHNCLSEKEREENLKRLQKAEIDKIEFGEFESFDENTSDDSLLNIIFIPTDSIRVTDTLDNLKGKSDEFGEFLPMEESNLFPIDNAGDKHNAENTNLKWIIIALLASVLAGFLVKFKPTRKLRGAFLISSVAIFGFYLGGCPCPISSMQNVVLAGLGVDKGWQGMLWFLGLIPITFLFGKTWCGWVCHLGGLQELIYKPGRLELFRTEKAQRIFKWARIALLVILIGQIILTKSNLFKEIDPFKAAFNLYAPNITVWVLLVLLLASSIFIYRPFCRAVCPVGLVLGWIGKIPGASVLDNSGSCNACVVCHKNCAIGAITREKGYSELNNEECIRCGECIDSCKRNGLKFFKKNSEHKIIVECKKVA